MSHELFENLLKKVAPLIQKQNTHLRESISPAERLSLTLRHLATGMTIISNTFFKDRIQLSVTDNCCTKCTSEHHNLQRAGYVARYLTRLFDNSLNTDRLWLQYVPTLLSLT